MFFSLFLSFVCSALITNPQQYTIEWNLTIINNEFRNIQNSPAITLNAKPNGYSYEVYIKYCFFNGCKGSGNGAAIYSKANPVLDFQFNCVYDCESTVSGVIYIDTYDNSDLAQKVHFLTARSCFSEWNTFLFRSENELKLLASEFQDSNISMCTSNNDGVLFFQDFWIDVLYCNLVFNKGYKGLFVKYDVIFGNKDQESGDIHHCNFNNNYVRQYGTVYQDSSVSTNLSYLYFLENDEIYTIESKQSSLQLSNIFCDNWKPGGYISYSSVISNGFTREPHTFYRTANCYVDITPSPTPPQSLKPTTPYDTPTILHFLTMHHTHSFIKMWERRRYIKYMKF